MSLNTRDVFKFISLIDLPQPKNRCTYTSSTLMLIKPIIINLLIIIY